MLVKSVDSKNYDKIMNGKKAEITQEYFEVLRLFTKKIGRINPNDYEKFNVLKSLSASHSKEEIVEAINNISI